MQAITDILANENKAVVAGDDFTWVMSKSRRWFVSYLADKTVDACEDPETKKQLIRILGDSFKERMLNDSVFYHKVEKFVLARRTAGEKKRFFKVVANEVFASIDLYEAHRKAYPSGYEDSSDEDEYSEYV